MNENALHAERIGDRAGMLASGAAEAGECIARHVVTARDRDLANGSRHVVDRDFEKTFGDRLQAFAADRIGYLLKSSARRPRVERQIAIGAKHRRELRWIDPPEEQVAVGDGQRPAVAIAGGPGVRAGALRPDPESHSIETADRPAAGCYRVD